MKVVVMDDAGNVVELPPVDEVPNWLKQKRTEKKISMQDLGEQLGVTKQAVYSWESGIATPTPENLAKLVALFGEQTQKTVKAVKSSPSASRMAAKLRAGTSDSRKSAEDLLMSHAQNVSKS